jgi:hypothetical protein
MKQIDPSYDELAEGPLETIIYGDTDSIFLHVEPKARQMCMEKFQDQLENRSEDEILAIIDDIIEHVTNKINNEYIADFSASFGIKQEHNRMYFKSEITASVTYFLNVKKKYALKVLAKEGVRVNEYDLKGIETRRSDYATFSKKLVGDIIFNYILEKSSVSKIIEFTAEQKTKCIELITAGDSEISVPKSFSRSISEYKQVPAHVKAMLFYNHLMDKEEFRPGSKGYHFYITGINKDEAPPEIVKRYNSFKGEKKAIVIPFEKKLPSWINVDVSLMLDGVYTSRLKNLLAPMDIIINAGNIEENLELEF